MGLLDHTLERTFFTLINSLGARNNDDEDDDDYDDEEDDDDADNDNYL